MASDYVLSAFRDFYSYILIMSIHGSFSLSFRERLISDIRFSHISKKNSCSFFNRTKAGEWQNRFQVFPSDFINLLMYLKKNIGSRISNGSRTMIFARTTPIIPPVNLTNTQARGISRTAARVIKIT